MNGAPPREQIIELLKKHPEGLTITTISELTRLHRHTVTKYVYELRGADIIHEREIGPAKLCYMKDGLTKKQEKQTMSRLNNHNMKSSLGSVGQIQLVAVFMFLVLAPAAVITAYNLTNTSENTSFSMEGYITANNEVTSDVSDGMLNEFWMNITNGTFGENATNETLPPGEGSPLPPQDAAEQTNETGGNATVDVDETLNATNITQPENEANETLNITEPLNETNVTVSNSTIIISDLTSPFEVNVTEEFSIKAVIMSLYGRSENIRVNLSAPASFEVANQNQTIPFLDENTSAEFAWNATASECGNYTLGVLAESDTSSAYKNVDVFVVCPVENVTLETETIQGDAEVGKPVVWKKIITVRNPNRIKVDNVQLETEIPAKAFNAELKKLRHVFGNTVT